MAEPELSKLKPCPYCGKLMIARWTRLVTGTGRMWEWWCGCAHSEPGGHIVDISPRGLDRVRWEQVNKLAGSKV